MKAVEPWLPGDTSGAHFDISVAVVAAGAAAGELGHRRKTAAANAAGARAVAAVVAKQTAGPMDRLTVLALGAGCSITLQHGGVMQAPPERPCR